MPELLHVHVVVRTQMTFNVNINRTQAVYACAAQRLGCSWGRILQVAGDALTDRTAQVELKKAEAALAPPAPAKDTDV